MRVEDRAGPAHQIGDRDLALLQLLDAEQRMEPVRVGVRDSVQRRQVGVIEAEHEDVPLVGHGVVLS